MKERPRPLFIIDLGDCYKAYMDDQLQFDYVEVYPGSKCFCSETLEWSDVPEDLKSRFEDMRMRKMEHVEPDPLEGLDEVLEDGTKEGDFHI